MMNKNKNFTALSEAKLGFSSAELPVQNVSIILPFHVSQCSFQTRTSSFQCSATAFFEIIFPINKLKT